MQPPVEFQDRQDYKARMNDLLEVDPQQSVALTIDMQRDYLDPSVASAPVDAATAERVVARTAAMLDFCRGQGIPVVHVYVSRRAAETQHGFYNTPYGRASQRARLSQNPNGKADRGPDRIEGSPQVEVVSELVRDSDMHVVTKRAQDSFHLTDLDMLLTRVLRPETLIITGINTDTCVYATTFGASNRGYAPVVVSDCVGSMRGEDHHWMALELMSRSIAWVLSSDELMAKIAPAEQRLAASH